MATDLTKKGVEIEQWPSAQQTKRSRWIYSHRINKIDAEAQVDVIQILKLRRMHKGAS